MSIRRIRILGNGEIVQVDELMTVDTADKLSHQLWAENLCNEAKTYENQVKATTKSGRHSFWDNVWIGGTRDLTDKEYQAYLAARFKGKKQAYTCVY